MFLKIIDHFKYPSTLKGIFSLLTAFGVAIKPELQEAIIALGLAAVGLIQVFVDDTGLDKASK